MKKRIFNFLTALCLCLTLLPTVAAAEKTAGTATEVKTSDELVGALADHDKAVVKLVENTVTVAPGGKIESGTETKFMAKASNYGTISGGTFETEVTNNGEITGGMFNGGVTGSGTISQEREVSNEESFLAALADPTITTIKLMGEIWVNETETVKELTIDRAITLVNSSRAPLHLNLPLTISEDGALTLDGLEGVVSLNPYKGMVVNGSLTVGAGCGVLFEGENASLVINEGGTVTTQPARENTTPGELSLGQDVTLMVKGALNNQGRLSVSDMENLKKAAAIGGELMLYNMTVNENYTLDMKGYPLTISSSLNFAKDANLTVKNASRVDATGVTISGGSYYCPVNVGNAEGVITGGSFYGPVTVKKISDATPAYISGGTFYGGISGMYMISGGTFYNGSFQEGFGLPEAGGIESGCKVVTYKNGEDVYAVQVVNGKASAPDTPVKSGYRFVGWYNGNAKWDFDTPVTENLTLTAKWEKIHTSAPSAPRYDVAVSDGAHGSVSVSPKSASKGSTVTVTVTPDKGYALETLAITDKNGNALDLTDQGGGQYTFTMSSGPVTVTATFMDDNTMLNFFVDVPAGAYYYDAVLWAAEGGIVTGTDAVHFSPDASCTRAQLVTFLWRAAGSPVVNYAMNFNDVDGGAYYAEAVRWAASLGIAGGYGDGRFGTNDFVTREQVAAILHRFAKAQGMDTTQGGMAIREFDDFDAVPAYALEAMDWAVNAGVLKGDNNRLLPQDNCTRAQIVTMLYRALGEK